MRTVLVAALLLLGCRGAAPPVRQPAQGPPSTAPPTDTTFPPPPRGTLAAHPAEPGGLGGEWPARAAYCADPRMLQVLARGDTVDLMIVLWLPAGDTAAPGSYAVLPTDSAAAPRTARVGAQRMLYADVSYRGQRGTVWLERLDQQASGRFDVVLEGSPTNDHFRYLGRFTAVPVDSTPGPQCRAAERDSASSARGQRPILD